MKILLLILLFILSSCSHQTNKKARVQLYVFDCGESDIKDISLFSPGVDKGVSKTLVASCYLVKHPKGTLMWDAGLSDSLVKKTEGIKVRNGAFTLKVKRTLISQFESMGLSPESIDYLSFSHMHPDHTGNSHLFKKATVILQDEEYAAAFGKHPEKYSFNKATYQGLKKNKFIKLNGDYDVFGDGRVIIKRAPGHTPGHQVLFVDLEREGAIVLSGDLYHFEKNRKYRRVPSFNFNKSMTLHSMDEIEKFVSDKHAKLWIQHDPDQRKKIKLAPQFYR